MHLVAETEQAIVQFICLHLLFGNWTLTCLALAALRTLVCLCCCKFYGQVKKTNFMAPFYGWGSTASTLEPLRGGTLFFTLISP